MLGNCATGKLKMVMAANNHQDNGNHHGDDGAIDKKL